MHVGVGVGVGMREKVIERWLKLSIRDSVDRHCTDDMSSFFFSFHTPPCFHVFTVAFSFNFHQEMGSLYPTKRG